jgi:hypothetical protein
MPPSNFDVVHITSIIHPNKQPSVNIQPQPIVDPQPILQSPTTILNDEPPFSNK